MKEWNMRYKKEYIGINYFKIIAAFLVIAIHTSPFTSFNGNLDFVFTRIWARLAVPFFFMITGYFVLPQCLKEECNNINLKKYIVKISKIYVLAIIVYIPFNSTYVISISYLAIYRRKKNWRYKKCSTFYLHFPSSLYHFHPFFIILVRGFAKVIGLTWLIVDNSFIHYMMVLISTTIFSYFSTKIINRRRRINK